MGSIKIAVSSQKLSYPLVISPLFFDRPVLTVARELLGKVLVRQFPPSPALSPDPSLPARSFGGRKEGPAAAGEGGKLCGMITEVEAYDGPHDLACHGRFGCTARTAPMFGPAGHWYVYLAYGMHWMLNIVTGPVGYPAAVLIRGISEEWVGNSLSPRERVRVRGYPHWHLDGPGKLTRALSINRALNGKPATMDTGLWIEDRGIIIPPETIQRTPRIGVDYAGTWAKKPYRFVIK